MLDTSHAEHQVTLGGLRFTLMIGPDRIREGIDRLALQLAARYVAEEPVLVCVLNGGAIFHADLARALQFPLGLDYLRVSSYAGGMQSSGVVSFSAAPGTQMTGRNVIIVEDIVDTGRTADHLREYFHDQGAGSVVVATLLYKRDAHHVGPPPEFVVFDIPDRFVVGFGLDYHEQGRNLPGIYVLDEATGPAAPESVAGQGVERGADFESSSDVSGRAAIPPAECEL
jgi:hypoxanthine phosphoribosyltransferase